MSESLQAIILGIVEGLTEFIPVSSTGHLILFGDLLQFHGSKAQTFEIFIQLGAILAVLFLYPKRFTSLLNFRNKDGFSGREGIFKLFLACLPAFVLGFLFYQYIRDYLFTSLTVALALLAGGILMILIEKRSSTPSVLQLEDISYKKCLGIGLFQCLALWPGMSRSASTIIGGLVLGLERRIAAEFSFLVAVPVMSAAVLYDLWKSRAFLELSDLGIFAVGFLVSFVVAILAIKFFISILKKYTLAPFGWYRILVGLFVLSQIYLMMG